MLTLPDGTQIRTEPEEYDANELRLELAKISTLTPKLDGHWQHEFRDLPDALQEQVRAISFLAAPTASGLERVSGILWQLYSVQTMIEQLLRGESIANVMAGSLDVPLPADAQPGERPAANPGSPMTLSPTAPKGDGTLVLRQNNQPAAKSKSTTTVSPVAAAPESQSATLTVSAHPPTPPSAGTLVIPSDLEKK